MSVWFASTVAYSELLNVRVEPVQRRVVCQEFLHSAVFRSWCFATLAILSSMGALAAPGIKAENQALLAMRSTRVARLLLISTEGGVAISACGRVLHGLRVLGSATILDHVGSGAAFTRPLLHKCMRTSDRWIRFMSPASRLFSRCAARRYPSEWSPNRRGSNDPSWF